MRVIGEEKMRDAVAAAALPKNQGNFSYFFVAGKFFLCPLLLLLLLFLPFYYAKIFIICFALHFCATNHSISLKFFFLLLFHNLGFS